MGTIASEWRMRRLGDVIQRSQPRSGEVRRGAASILSALSALSAALVWGQQTPQRVPSLAFTIDRKGNVLNSQIAMTSGSAVLDAEVLALINFRARPP